MKRLGKYTKEELVLLTKLYKEGLSIYKIARDLKRSQKSVRNNLIRLGLLEGKIITYRNDVIIDNKKSIINTTNLLLNDLIMMYSLLGDFFKGITFFLYKSSTSRKCLGL